MGCVRDVGNGLARKREEGVIALVRRERERFTIGEMDCLSERLRIICLMEQHRRAQRQNAQTPAIEHCQLSASLPHPASSCSFLVFSYFCGGFTRITCSYLTDSLDQSDFDPGNSGSHTHCIAPRRAPKCTRYYFSISLYSFTHHYSLESLPIFDFL